MNVCNIYSPTPNPHPASLHGFCVHPLPPHPFFLSFFPLQVCVCVLCVAMFCCFCGFSVSSKWDIQYTAEVLILTVQTENYSMMAACLFLYLTIHIILPFFCGCMCCLFAQHNHQPPSPSIPPPLPHQPLKWRKKICMSANTSVLCRSCARRGKPCCNGVW